MRHLAIGSVLLVVIHFAITGVATVVGQPAQDILSKFDTATGLLLTPLAINGKTFWCNVDSGFSALLTLDERLAPEANLSPGPASPTPDGNPPRPGDREARASLALGGLVLRDQPVILRKFFAEAPDLQCVMGVGVVRDYVVEFDHQTPAVRLYSRENFSAGQAIAVPLEVRRNTPFVTVDLQVDDGQPHRASLV